MFYVNSKQMYTDSCKPKGHTFYMGLSENSVPLHPMVLLIIIPTKWLFHWGYTPFSDIHSICPKALNLQDATRGDATADQRWSGAPEATAKF